MRAWMDRGVLRGRIHGRSLLVLVVVAALVSVAAVWQFGALRDEHDPDLAEADTPGGPQFTAAAETTSASAPASAPESPESSAASPSGDPTTSAAAAATSASAADAGPECTASLSLDTEWSSSISVAVSVANTGAEPIDGWEILLALDGMEVTAAWGLEHLEGDRYSDIMFNAAIAPGESVDPSFSADVEDGWVLPETVPCTPA